MMKKEIKAAALLTVVILAVVFIGRIIYVNLSYPYAGIKMRQMGESFQLKDFDLIVEEGEAYSRKEWENYLKERSIMREEESYNIRYVGSDEEVENVDYWIMYDPDSEYTVVVIDTTVINKTESAKKFSLSAGVKLLGDLVSSEEPYSDYYSACLSGLRFDAAPLAIDIQPGAECKIKIVYMCKEYSDEYVLEHLELGNNQRMNLKLK